VTRTPKTDPDAGGNRRWLRDWARSVRHDSRFDAAVKLTASVLAEYAWVSAHTVAISTHQLAALTGRSQKTEATYLKVLTELGWVFDTGRRQNRRYVYQLEYPGGWQENQGRPRKRGWAAKAWEDPIYAGSESVADSVNDDATDSVEHSAVVGNPQVDEPNRVNSSLSSLASSDSSTPPDGGGRRASAREPIPASQGHQQADPPEGSGGSTRVDDPDDDWGDHVHGPQGVLFCGECSRLHPEVMSGDGLPR
jgi:hypothetical protein